MTNDEYVRTQTELIALGKFVLMMDLPEFLDRICLAESVTPITDPSLWLRGNKKLAQVKKLAQAANELRSAFICQLELEGVDWRELVTPDSTARGKAPSTVE
jgi:hypothetical protein